MSTMRFASTPGCSTFRTWAGANMPIGRIRYALICNQEGGVLDDVLAYRLLGDTFINDWLLVVNASNRLKILDWIAQHRADLHVDVVDLTFDHAMVAIQGPDSVEIAERVTGAKLGALKYYESQGLSRYGASALVSRTGYTGEDGFEIILPRDAAVPLWEELLSFPGATPCGLGCRDTLRLEAGMPLYGHELDESIDPLTAGLEFAVKLKKPEFIGRDALVRRAKVGCDQTRVGLQLTGRRIAREGSAIFVDGASVGRVTSGTFSPTLEKPIAMGYVNREVANAGRQLEVDIRGQRESATIVPLPFYHRAR
jgi:aminomethyltransferase